MTWALLLILLEHLNPRAINVMPPTDAEKYLSALQSKTIIYI